MLTTPITPFGPLSRPNSKKYSGNKVEIKIELTYAFPNRIPVWEPGRSDPKINYIWGFRDFLKLEIQRLYFFRSKNI